METERERGWLADHFKVYNDKLLRCGVGNCARILEVKVQTWMPSDPMACSNLRFEAVIGL